MGKMSRGIWRQQLLFLVPSLISAAVASANPLENTAFGGDNEFPSLGSVQMGSYLNPNLCSVLQSCALHMVQDLPLHQLLYLLHHEEAAELQRAEPAGASFAQMPIKKCSHLGKRPGSRMLLPYSINCV